MKTIKKISIDELKAISRTEMKKIMGGVVPYSPLCACSANGFTFRCASADQALACVKAVCPGGTGACNTGTAK